MTAPDTAFYREWFGRRLAVANAIVREHGEAFEADAEILLCCALSGVAALAWPRRSNKELIDRSRFTQLLVDFAPANYGMTRISIPTLIAMLVADGDIAGADALRREFYPDNDSRIMTARELDQDEARVHTLISGVKLKVIRECSYAGMIYIDLRSGLVHEHALSGLLIDFSMSQRTSGPSYVNLVGEGQASPERRLHFPYSWFREMLSATVDALFTRWETAGEEELTRPSKWWIQG